MHIDSIEKTIKEDKLAAEIAAKEARASQLFAQALSEQDASVAIELYTRAIENKPDFSKAYNNRGNFRKQLGDLKGAMQDYNKAIELDPKNAKAYYNRGILKVLTNAPEGPMEDYNKAIELDPKYAKAYNNRGVQKVRTGDIKGAIKDYDKALSIDKTNKLSYENRAKLFRKLAETEQDATKKAELNAKAEADEQNAALIQ